MNTSDNINTKLVHTIFLQRENMSRHHSYDDELRQYQSLRQGELTTLDERTKLFDSELTGHLSDDPLCNAKYLFVASITLATRFSIESGLPSEVAYNMSDLYIQEMDLCPTISKVRILHDKMIEDFTLRNAKEQLKPSYSKTILLCMDYIYYHLHKTITVANLSQHVQLNPSTLSTRFKQETSVSVSEYIRQKRIEAAENMLKFSDYTYLEIANYLAFSNHSHFITLFKKSTGLTPKAYRNKYFRHNWQSNTSPI